MIVPVLAEIIGTFIFVTVILNLTTTDNGIFTAVAIGLTLAAVIYFASKASLGSMNPAVTLGLFLRGNLDGTTALAYVIAELIGAVLAFMWWKQVTSKKK